MAWSEKLPSGKYRGLYRDHHGRKHTVKDTAGKTRLFTHKAEAVREAGSKETDARKSIWADPDAGRRTWGEWVDEWWPTRTVEASTLVTQSSNRDHHLRPRWGAVPIGSIRRHDVKAWAAGLLRTGLSPSTVQRQVHLLSASLAAAVDAEILDANPAARIKLPKGAQAVERYLTVPEFESIVDDLPSLLDWLVAQFLANTGVRWGEMAGMHVDRLIPDLQAVRIIETYDEKSHRIKAYPKSRSARTVPVPAWLMKVLLEVDRPPGPCPVPHAVGRCRGPLLFTTAGGAVLRDTNWTNRVWLPAVSPMVCRKHRELEQAVPVPGCPDCRSGVHPRPRVHDLRHTYASWLLQGGKTLEEVRDLLGHASIVTTERYAHLERKKSSASVSSLLPAAPDLPQWATETGRPRQDSNLRPTD